MATLSILRACKHLGRVSLAETAVVRSAGSLASDNHLFRASCQHPGVPRGNAGLAGTAAPGVVLSPYGEIATPKENLSAYVFRNAHNYPDKPAITCGSTGREYSFGIVHKMSLKCAQALLTVLNLKPGDMVGIILPNIPEFTFVVYGALEAGLKVTFANPLYTEVELARQFLNADVKSIVTVDMFMDKAKHVKNKLPGYNGTIVIGGESNQQEGIHGLQTLLLGDYNIELPKVDPQEVAVVPYSSGTTGLPKGVMLTHNNLTVNLEQMHHAAFRKYEHTSGYNDTILTVPPFFHIYGFNGILNYNLAIGNHVVSFPRFTPEDYIKCLITYRPKALFVVPSIVAFLATHPSVTSEHLSSIEDIVIGAAPMRESMLERFLKKSGKSEPAIRIQQGYGMTESSPAITITPFKNPRSKIISIGQPIPSTQCKVISLETGKPVGPHENGELLIKGPQVMKGYLKNESATKDTITDDGWLQTGDIVYYDEDSYFFTVDRNKELIKVKGNQVSPTELENIILEIPDIADAAVIGVDDEKSGELPKAFVVLKPGSKVSEKNVYDWVTKQVVEYKRLDGGISIIDAIPRNPSGKILRMDLKKIK